MLLLLLACVPNSLPVARSLALGPPSHVWGDSAQLHLAWEGGSQDRASIPWGQLGQLELRHLTEGDELFVHADGRPILLMQRREGRLDREAELLGGWSKLVVQELGASQFEVQPWSFTGTPNEPAVPAAEASGQAAAQIQGWVAHCTAERIERVPNISGVVDVQVQVLKGQVSYAAILTDTVRDPMFNDCILRAGIGKPLDSGGELRVSICEGVRDCG